MNHLRQLSLHIEEPETSEFYWVILESKEDATVWAQVSAAMHARHTWGDAWAEGVMEYMKFVRDRRVGPRAEGEDEDANPVG